MGKGFSRVIRESWAISEPGTVRSGGSGHVPHGTFGSYPFGSYLKVPLPGGCRTAPSPTAARLARRAARRLLHCLSLALRWPLAPRPLALAPVSHVLASIAAAAVDCCHLARCHVPRPIALVLAVALAAATALASAITLVFAPCDSPSKTALETNLLGIFRLHFTILLYMVILIIICGNGPIYEKKSCRVILS